MARRSARKKQFSRGEFIVIAVVISVFLYTAGVISGLYANNILEKKVEVDLNDLKSFVDNSALDIKSIQLQQLYLDSLDNKCEFQDLYINHLYDQLGSYWDILPSRLEEYDKIEQPSDDYIALKREYIRLSLRFWIIAKDNYEHCNNQDIIPVLYFYSKACDKCIDQGKEFDKFNMAMSKKDKRVVVFPIDSDFEDDTVFLLKEYYNITKFPATLVNNELIQGQVITSVSLRTLFE